MAKKDPHKHEQSYKRWKERGMAFDGVSDALSATLREYLLDMELGANVSPSSPRGARSYCRLNNLRSRTKTLALYLQREIGLVSWDELAVKERELLVFVKELREKRVKPLRDGQRPIRTVGTYVKVLKAFWHWYMRVQKKGGKTLPDVTVDIDARDPKAQFNYLTIDNVKRLVDEAKKDYQVLMMFLFDSGIRAPTELMNVRVQDLELDERTGTYTLNIREETSKTFGRRIKLLLSSEMLKTHLERSDKKPDEYIFTKTPQRVNQYLKRLGNRILGTGELTIKGTIRDGLTMYDFRHASACYWTPRYKSESALKYRFGWKKSDMIHYYTELLGMKDTIQEEDLYVDITKTDLERQIQDGKKEIELLKEQLQTQAQQTKKMMQVLRALELEKQFETRA